MATPNHPHPHPAVGARRAVAGRGRVVVPARVRRFGPTKRCRSNEAPGARDTGVGGGGRVGRGEGVGEECGACGVERCGVLAQVGRGAGECPRDARSQLALQHRQHVGAHAAAQRVAGLARVGRVVPRVEAERLAHRERVLAPDAEQGPAQPSAHRGHTRQGTPAGAPGEAEQDRLGLVVEGVAEQHGGGPGLVRRPFQRGVPRGACGGLGPTRAEHLHAHDEHGVEPERAALLRGALGDVG